jgi:hypothetical protein
VSDHLLDVDPWYEGLGATTKERQDNYREWIEMQSDEGEWDGIRHATQRGRLIGRETFQKQVEAMTGRRLVGEARGRPKKMAGMSIEKIL